MTNIAFPGIGIEGFDVNRVAFTLPIGDGMPVYWYGIIITLGIIMAVLYVNYRSKNEGIKTDDVLDIALWTVVCGVLGARLYYVVTSLDNFVPKPFDFMKFIKNVFSFRDGGLAIYGGIICGCAAIIIACLVKKINPLKLTDMAAPGVMIGQLMGRWGNFFNAEAHGCIVNEGHPLYFLRMGLLPNENSKVEMYYYHPTFLYESVWNLVGFLIINSFYKKKKFNGQISCMYLAWYGFGRMFIESLRTDSLYVGSIRISQLVGALCFIVFGGLLIAGLIYSKRFNIEGYEAVGFANTLKPSLMDRKEAIRIEKEEIAKMKAEKNKKNDKNAIDPVEISEKTEDTEAEINSDNVDNEENNNGENN